MKNSKDRGIEKLEVIRLEKYCKRRCRMRNHDLITNKIQEKNL